jgi:beta-N-acetylhexosaminidase
VVLAALATAAAVAFLTPQEKAALVVVSGQPAPVGVGGVLVQPATRGDARPWGSVVFADQEGGPVRAFRELPPFAAASSYTSEDAAYAAARTTAHALGRVDVDVDLAPVVDLADGPLGSRQFADPRFALAFARGLGRHACVKHFPGLGTLPVSTDARLRVHGHLRPQDLAPFAAAIRAGVACVMVGHGIYPSLGPRRAVIERSTYRLLRGRLGFRGVAITDSMGVLGDDGPRYGVEAIRAGADLALFTSPSQAAEAERLLLPLARSGALDVHVVRVLALRQRLGR